MKTVVLLFQPQFAKLVAIGFKLQTVRPVRKRMPAVGDKVSLRAWVGKPYRSKQRILRESEIVGVATFKLSYFGVMGLDDLPMDQGEQRRFARADGFADEDEMWAWFNKNHAMPFNGIVIYWK